MRTREDEGFVVGQALPVDERELAVCFEVDTSLEDLWIPKSQIHDDSEVWETGQETGTLVVKSWFARKKGWV